MIRLHRSLCKQFDFELDKLKLYHTMAIYKEKPLENIEGKEDAVNLHFFYFLRNVFYPMKDKFNVLKCFHFEQR